MHYGPFQPTSAVYIIYFFIYQIYQLGTERHTQKAQACMRCLPVAKELRSKEN